MSHRKLLLDMIIFCLIMLFATLGMEFIEKERPQSLIMMDLQFNEEEEDNSFPGDLNRDLPFLNDNSELF